MILGSTPLYHHNIAVSQDVANSCWRYPPLYKKRLQVIHNGVPPLPKINDNSDECRDILNLPKECFLIGSLGRLDRQKNVTVLLEMMPLLSNNVYLAIAGTGHLEGELKQQAKESGLSDRIIFLGNLHGKEVTQFYCAIDVFAFAAHFEGFGRTLVEAFSMGRPVVATELEVFKEIAEETAVTYIKNEAGEWAQAIIDLEQSPEKRERLIENGKSRSDYGARIKKLVKEKPWEKQK